MRGDNHNTGQVVELGRYTTDRGEERLLAGQRIEGVVTVFDRPMAGDRLRGASYFVESGFRSMSELAMFRLDYLAQAERIGDSPMSCRALRRITELDRLAELAS
jgi:hypothetical protein